MSFSIDLFIETLNARFENLTASYQELDYNGKIPVFFVRSKSLVDLTSKWSNLVDAIAFDFQSQLNDEFQIWNIYIFFIKPPDITDILKYNSLKLKIENDTFSSRKILVEDHDADQVINEHILNQNMNFSPDCIAEPTVKFEADPLLWSILEDKVLKKQKITSEAGSAFDELVKKLSSPRNEI